jgi:3-hydroxybutyryl-CoA dehydrogenase
MEQFLLGDIMEIRSIAVLGAGQMGNGIAQVAACAGYEVVMIDIKQEYVDAGLSSIENSLTRLVSKDRMTEQEAEEALALVSISTEKSAAADADLVVEAIPEIPQLKF